MLGLEPVQSCLGVARVMSNYGYKRKSVPVIFEPPCINNGPPLVDTLRKVTSSPHSVTTFLWIHFNLDWPKGVAHGMLKVRIYGRKGKH